MKTDATHKLESIMATLPIIIDKHGDKLKKIALNWQTMPITRNDFYYEELVPILEIEFKD